MTPKKMRPKPYNRPKNGKGPSGSEQLSSFDSSRYENSRPRPISGNRNYQQLFDKYTNLAKEALGSGDRVAAEFNYQYADHYLRLINERQSYRALHEKPKRADPISEESDGNLDKLSEDNEGSETEEIPMLELDEENIVEPKIEEPAASS